MAWKPHKGLVGYYTWMKLWVEKRKSMNLTNQVKEYSWGN